MVFLVRDLLIKKSKKNSNFPVDIKELSDYISKRMIGVMSARATLLKIIR